MRYIYIFSFSYDVLTAQQYKQIYAPTLLLQKMRLIKKLENDKNNGEGHSLQQNDQIHDHSIIYYCFAAHVHYMASHPNTHTLLLSFLLLSDGSSQ